MPKSERRNPSTQAQYKSEALFRTNAIPYQSEKRNFTFMFDSGIQSGGGGLLL